MNYSVWSISLLDHWIISSERRHQKRGVYRSGWDKPIELPYNVGSTKSRQAYYLSDMEDKS